MKKKLVKTAHAMAKDLYKAGVIDKVTMRGYDALCIPPVKTLSPRQIKHIRLCTGVSQTVFALYLNTTLSTVMQWEQGLRHPSGTSLKLLNIVAKNGLALLAQ